MTGLLLTARKHQGVLLASALALLVAVIAVAPVGGLPTARLVVAGCLVALVMVQWAIDWRVLVIALTVWLVLLGLVRRLMTTVSDLPPADPLLLIAPIAFGLLAITAIRTGALSRRSALTTAVLGLTALTVLETANVTRVPLVANVAGLLFVLVPQLAFWLGRIITDATLYTLLRVLRGLALVAAGYGLLQTFWGFLPWDSAWVRESGYTALYVADDVVRPFGTSASSAEYTVLLMIGIVCWLVLPAASRWLTVAAVAVLATALVLASSRGPIVIVIAAIALIGAARLSVPGRVAIVAIAGATTLIPLIASILVPYSDDASTASSHLIRHQVEGLANPFDPETSTLLHHVTLVTDGLSSAVEHPFGLGIGVITPAKFGGQAASTEADLSNVAVGFGLIGVVLFLAAFALGMLRAYRFASRTQAPLAIAALGILVVTMNFWLNGGMYAVAWLPWLVLGWLDRPVKLPGWSHQ